MGLRSTRRNNWAFSATITVERGTRRQAGTPFDPDGAFRGRGSKEDIWVEVSGLEPPASSLRTKRSSQLSYTPLGETEDSGRARWSPTHNQAAIGSVRSALRLDRLLQACLHDSGGDVAPAPLQNCPKRIHSAPKPAREGVGEVDGD